MINEELRARMTSDELNAGRIDADGYVICSHLLDLVHAVDQAIKICEEVMPNSGHMYLGIINDIHRVLTLARKAIEE